MQSSSRQPERRAALARSWRRGVMLMLALLAGCAGKADDGNRLSVRNASITATVGGPILQLSLDARLGETLQDALDHGIPLTFVIHVRSDDDALQATRRVEMRYFPLSRRYVLRDRDRSDILRSAIAPAYLVDAMGALRVSLDREIKNVPDDVHWHIDVRLERNALPGALRLPALLSRAWHLRAKEFEWTAGAG